VKRNEARVTDRAFHKNTRFLLDENIGKLASILRELGLHAHPLTRQDRGAIRTKTFSLQAGKQKWVVMSNDRDFLDDRKYPFHRCPGVLILPSPANSLDNFANALEGIGTCGSIWRDV
jgi:Mut7-C RNAse domain